MGYFFCANTNYQREFFLWICGTLQLFFPENYKISFLSELSENNADIDRVQSISIITSTANVFADVSESMQVIFHLSDRISEWFFGTGSEIISSV